MGLNLRLPQFGRGAGLEWGTEPEGARVPRSEREPRRYRPGQRAEALQRTVAVLQLSQGNRKQRLKERLFLRQRGLCHWCRCGMELLPPIPKRHDPPDNEATIEHLRSRLDPSRKEPATGDVRRVLACRSCNNERGREEVLKVPLEERQRWARGHRK